MPCRKRPPSAAITSWISLLISVADSGWYPEVMPLAVVITSGSMPNTASEANMCPRRPYAQIRLKIAFSIVFLVLGAVAIAVHASGAAFSASTGLVDLASPARVVLELGRYLVAEAGWYLTTVVGQQTFQGRPAVIVDGGVHQRADMCGLCLRTNQSPPLDKKPIPDNPRRNHREGGEEEEQNGYCHLAIP